MSVRRVVIDELKINRVRGIPGGEGFTLSELATGVNLVSGSNGSGKSTTALAIEQVLWPTESVLARPTIEATLRESDSTWSVDLDAGHLAVTRNGIVAPPPSFAPATARTGHHLSLVDLIVATDHDFAKRLARERRGGFDLDEAAVALKWAPPSERQPRQFKNFQTADAAVRHAKADERALAERESALATLRVEHERSTRAQSQLESLRALREWRTHDGASERCARELAALPEGLRSLGGDEVERLDEIDRRSEAIGRDRDEAVQERMAAERTLREAALPEVGIAPATLVDWRERARSIIRTEAALVEARTRLARADREESQRRRMIGAETDAAALAVLDDSGLGAIADHVRRATEHERQCIEAEARVDAFSMPEEQSAEVSDPTTLRDAIAALGQWLATPTASTEAGAARHDGSNLLPLLVATALAVILAIVLAVVWHWAWLVVAVVPFAVLLWGLLLSVPNRTPAENPRENVDLRNAHRARFLRLGIAEPSVWEADEIASHLESLTEQLAIAQREQERQRELERLRHRLTKLCDAGAPLKSERHALIARFGLPVGTDHAWLAASAANLAHWRDASAALESARGEVAALDAERATALDGLGDEIAPVLHAAHPDAAASSTGEGALAQVEQIAERETSRRAAAMTIERCAKTSMAKDGERVELAHARAAIYGAVGLVDGDRAALDTLLASLADRRRIESDLREATTLRDNARRTAPEDPALLALSGEEIDQRVATLEAAASPERQRDLLKDILEIERDLRQATDGHNLADCLADRDRALVDLERELAGQTEALVGHALIEFVRSIDADRSRPPIERRASALLADFTGGALSLRVDDRDREASFRVQTVGGSLRPLHELSVGERIQTLIAVRLAFLEQEESARLPLILDETLATSDDRRTETIIDTILTIAADRQVFCFTAQRDEANKWFARLEGRDVLFRHFDLDTIRGRARAEALPLIADRAPIREVPPPDGIDHASYATLLGVPALDPRDVSQDRLHLWHLIDDPVRLHTCLVAGVSTWAQTRTILDTGSSLLDRVGLDAQVLRAVKARADVVRQACGLWRVGRGHPVDRAALAEAAGVSKTFLDRVVELADACDGDALRLIQALREGALPRWRGESTDQLRDWLNDRGHLDESPRLDRDAIRIRLLTDADDAISTEFVDRTLANLPA